jgi:restriction system protein
MIPDFQIIMLPLLESLKEGDEQTIKQTHHSLAAYFELSDNELNEHLPGNDQTLFYSRIL